LNRSCNVFKERDSTTEADLITLLNTTLGGITAFPYSLTGFGEKERWERGGSRGEGGRKGTGRKEDGEGKTDCREDR